MKFVDVNKYLIGILMYKVKNRLLPDFFQNVFFLNSSIHNYNTRQSQYFHLFPVRTNTRLFSIKFRGPSVWNEIPQNICNRLSLSSFKSHFKRFLVYVE